ncbi:hypothetical protein AUJ68_06660 [Candidatus Woesearchaeota archaeon CG1_02_57_44]|nr:MAG: hypothetical protein AUJ68_06660 [Candidatus Woesearchaeota archaeon CG1_02_57_44]
MTRTTMDERTDKTISSYDANVAEYEASTKDIIPQALTKVAAMLPEGPVLDVGAGYGRDALWLQQQGFEVICMEPSARMRERCKERGLKKVIDGRMEHLQALQHPEGGYAGILFVGSLLHVPKKAAPNILKTAASLLKEGGIIYLALQHGKGEVMRSGGMLQAERFFALYERDEARALLASAGLHVVWERMDEKWMNFIVQKA